jgi:tetratricopeptide (TPR) repeat protein
LLSCRGALRVRGSCALPCSPLLLAACSAPHRAPPPPVKKLTATERADAATRGRAAYEAKDFATCATLLEQAGEDYDAACCFAQGGKLDPAFAALGRAIDKGFTQVEHLKKDTDLDPLHGDARWTEVVAKLEAKVAAYRASLDPELAQLFEDDQADRRKPFAEIDWKVVGPRDEAREKRVDELVAAGRAKVSDDYYHAAMVHQHGQTVEAIEKAHDLAKKAVALDPANKKAKWLMAASEDRILVRRGQPQKWATQYKRVDGVWQLEPVDPAITDEQRAAAGVPSLAEAKAQAARLE